MQHCISSPSEATIKYKRIQIAQGPSCETDPLSPFGDFLSATPIAVGVNLTCIRSKLVKKHSSMREAISKIFSKAEREKWRHCLKPLLNMLQFCTHRLLTLYQPVCRFSILTGMIYCNSKRDRRKEEKIKMATVLQTSILFYAVTETFTTLQAMSLIFLMTCGVTGPFRRNSGCGVWGFGVLDRIAEKQEMRPFVASPSSSCMEEGW